MKKFLGLKIQIGGFSVDDLVVVTKVDLVNSSSFGYQKVYGARGVINKINGDEYTVKIPNAGSLKLSSSEIKSEEDFEKENPMKQDNPFINETISLTEYIRKRKAVPTEAVPLVKAVVAPLVPSQSSIGGFSVGDEVVVIKNEIFVNKEGRPTNMYGLHGRITKFYNGSYTVDTGIRVLELLNEDIVSKLDYEKNKVKHLETKEKWEKEREQSLLPAIDPRLLAGMYRRQPFEAESRLASSTETHSKWKSPSTKAAVAAAVAEPVSESSLSFLSPIEQTKATKSLISSVPLPSTPLPSTPLPSTSSNIQASLQSMLSKFTGLQKRTWEKNDVFRNKFTGEIDEILFNIQPNAWVCGRIGQLYCSFEIEMISLEDEIPFITSFQFEPEKLEANGNKSLDFIKNVVNDYISRTVRLTIKRGLLSDNDLKRFGKEISKPFTERSIFNITDIKLIDILIGKFSKMYNFLSKWLNREEWYKLKEYYNTNIQRKGGFADDILSFDLYLLEAFYNRIMAVKKLYESEVFLQNKDF